MEAPWYVFYTLPLANTNSLFVSPSFRARDFVRSELWYSVLDAHTWNYQAACTCAGEAHPGPINKDGTYVGRSSPEIDVIEAIVNTGVGFVRYSCGFSYVEIVDICIKYPGITILAMGAIQCMWSSVCLYFSGKLTDLDNRPDTNGTTLPILLSTTPMSLS